jgi:hypothetical protein
MSLLPSAALPLGYWPASRFDTLWAIGDLHGDLTTAIVCLRDLARVARRVVDKRRERVDDTVVVPGKWEWCAPPRTCVIVLGDVLDRRRAGTKLVLDATGRQVGVGEQPDEEVHLLDLLADLQRQAPACDGALIFLLGNHELANLSNCSVGHAKRTCTDMWDPRARAQSLLPGGTLHSRLLALSPRALVQVGEWVFAHACIHSDAVRTAETFRMHVLDFVNTNTAAAFRTALDAQVLHALTETLLGKHGLCTYRGLSGDEECARSQSLGGCALAAFTEHNAKHGVPAVRHVVVGHSCQFSRDARACGAAEHLTALYEEAAAGAEAAPFGREVLVGLGVRPTGPPAYGINATPDGAVYRVDVAHSRAFETPDDQTWGVNITHDALESARRPAILRVRLAMPNQPTATVRATRPLGSARELF